MSIKHKNKTFCTLLAMLLGGLGAHRFYLYGKKDIWAWIHLVTLPLIIPIFAGFIAALVIGLTPDEKWDAQHNPNSGKNSDSNWMVIVLVILTFAVGATSLVAIIARLTDLYLTGGSYG